MPHQPAEWSPHRACWLAWPSDSSLWQGNLPLAQAEFTALCRAIADVDPKTGIVRGETLKVLVLDPDSEAVARSALTGLQVDFYHIPFGDIWLRDIAPIFVQRNGQIQTACFKFNGWGGKYVLDHDADVAAAIASVVGLESHRCDWVLEGGSIEVDGEGTCLTTRQCLLNPNRNPELSQAEIEIRLSQDLGIQKVLWLDEGLLNDHTDGHIDTLARFVAPGVVLCMEARDPNDPNQAVLAQIAKDLKSFTDAQGRNLKVVQVPSPGLILDEEGEVMPASYVNFYIGNRVVIVPTYGTPWDAEAVETIGKYFPERRTVGLSARAILAGGGAFHCITQQQI
jgi:agmatine deiminase